MDSCMGLSLSLLPFSLKKPNPSLSFQANSNKQPTSSLSLSLLMTCESETNKGIPSK